MTTREAEWDPDQQALILALARHRADTCDQCGGYLPETADKANEPLFEVAGPFICYSCEAVGRASASVAEKRKNNPLHNMSRWSARLRKR